MSSKKYLYGANVRGIQSYIFQTNKLKEIAGASEIVEQICTELFATQLGVNYDELLKDDKLYQSAAGGVKYLFNDKQSCQESIKTFAFNVRKNALGIQFNQAGILIEGQEPTAEEFKALESKLITNANKRQVVATPACMITNRSRRTGGIATKITIDKEHLDSQNQNYLSEEVVQKRKQNDSSKQRLKEKLFGKTDAELAKELEDLKGDNTWIGVIHADGNGLGAIIKSMQKAESGTGFAKLMKQFSAQLDRAIEKAAKRVVKYMNLSTEDITPVVIGGDDLTVIIKGAKAYKFTELFCSYFEYETKQHLSNIEVSSKDLHEKFKSGLTICAGIAYIKYNFPIHYGMHLAEELCKAAKNKSKGLDINEKPSSILFYKVNSSSVKSYTEIKKRELTSPVLSNQEPFVAGPYFLHRKENVKTIKDLSKHLKVYREPHAPSSVLREWLGELFENETVAAQHLARIKQIHSPYVNKLDLHIDDTSKVAGLVNDLIMLDQVGTEL